MGCLVTYKVLPFPGPEGLADGHPWHNHFLFGLLLCAEREAALEDYSEATIDLKCNSMCSVEHL